MNPNMNETTMPRLTALLVLFALFATPPAAAKKSDFKQPVDVQADRSEYDEQQGVQTLIGNVEITQGTMKILADRIAIHLRDNKLSSIEGVGSPIHFEQQNEAGELITGEAREINYDAVRGSLVLAGNATLSQPRQELVSERIVFDSRTQKVIAEGGDNGRVSIRIQPPTPDASGN
jgi:lipopolysaccharide export system protein LptA